MPSWDVDVIEDNIVEENENYYVTDTPLDIIQTSYYRR